jgi:hypothetical protein
MRTRAGEDALKTYEATHRGHRARRWITNSLSPWRCRARSSRRVPPTRPSMLLQER